MSTVDNKKNIIELRSWQRNRLRQIGLRPVDQKKIGPANVTVLTYFYRKPEQVEEFFPFTICAIQETWRHCGFMKTVIVVNEPSGPAEKFFNEYPDWVKLQVAPNLEVGSVDSMSLDCIANLHSRFSTNYVLIIQDDGFPLRQGLEDFIGAGDFLGSPFCRDLPHARIGCRLLNYLPSNGGFSLRTKKVCQFVSTIWERRWKDIPFRTEMTEDLFYTQTLPLKSLSYRLKMRTPSVSVAHRFAYDGCIPFPPKTCPFGFHSARAFRELRDLGFIPD